VSDHIIIRATFNYSQASRINAYTNSLALGKSNLIKIIKHACCILALLFPLQFSEGQFGGVGLLPQRVWFSAYSMPEVGPEELMVLYRADRLVTHTVPPALIDKRPDHMQDQHSIMCGSILFNEGYRHKPDNKWVHNAVARFGADSKETVFATLHDLNKIFDHHEQLEEQVLSEKGKQKIHRHADCSF
jgi:hypothetical protein